MNDIEPAPDSAKACEPTGPLIATPQPGQELAVGRICLPRTLAGWRSSNWKDRGPAYIRTGGRILYSRKAVEEWEKRQSKDQPPPAGD